MPRFALRLLALLTAASVGLLGCGGDDDDGGDAATDDTTATTEATGTTADEPEPEPEPEGEDSEVCDAVQRLSDLDDESQGVVNEALGDVMGQAAGGDAAAAEAALDEALAEIQAFVDERLPDLVAAYDDLEDTVPDDLADDVALISDFTEEFVRAIADVGSVEELQGLVDERQDEINEVAAAVQRLDEFTQEECGVAIAD